MSFAGLRGSFWKKKPVAQWYPLIDDAIDGFGLLNLYDIQPNSFSIERDLASTTNIPWDGELPYLADINSYIGVDPLAFYTNPKIYAQKNMESDLFINTIDDEFLYNELGTGKHAIKLTDVREFGGALDTSLSKNTDYFAVVMLAKAVGVTGSIRNFFFISTGTFAGRTRCSLVFNTDPSTGCAIGGRRATSDSATSVTSTHDCSNWTVFTGIWDYVGRNLILRINGNQVGINTSFGNGTNSENTNSLRQSIGESIGSTDFVGITIFNTQPSSFAQIEEIENRYMTYAGIL